MALSTIVTLMLGTAVSSSAAPAGRTPAVVPRVPTDKITELQAKIAALEKAYGGDLAKLRDARVAARKAQFKSRKLDYDLGKARRVVGQLAAAQYKSSGLDPAMIMMTGENPNHLLDGTVLAEHVSAKRAAQVERLRALAAEQRKARKEAKESIEELEDDIDKLLKRKDKVRALLRKYKPESPMVGSSGLTGRMLTVRTEIESKFGPFPMIGCLRPGDPQDHGSGRACDFMESTGGSYPDAERQAHGDQVAEYAIDNASRLGVSYVIWRQRIYDMRSPGWDSMSDRGSTTANHYDHVHISVF
ncbi:MAG: hypothetical protein GEV11_16760 [Streptosporangiales bacterium]|nr:hypothetical protein [Streptosporangiales bacterium]